MNAQAKHTPERGLVNESAFESIRGPIRELYAERDALAEQNRALADALRQIAEADHPDYPHFKSGTEMMFSDHLMDVARAALKAAEGA